MYNTEAFLNEGVNMVCVEFLGPIDKAPLYVDITRLDELSILLKKDPQMRIWLDDCAIAINDVITSDKQHILKDGDKVSLLPPVCGG